MSNTTYLKHGDLKRVADSLGVSYSYIRQVNGGFRNNARIQEAIDKMCDIREAQTKQKKQEDAEAMKALASQTSKINLEIHWVFNLDDPGRCLKKKATEMEAIQQRLAKLREMEEVIQNQLSNMDITLIQTCIQHGYSPNEVAASRINTTSKV